MNIAFFLTPKHEVVSLTLNTTLRQTLERMEYHRYTAVPILNDEGEYVGTVTEGDLLWHMKNSNGAITFENASKSLLKEVSLNMHNKSVRIDSNMEDLINLAKVQNFVPVVDDMNRFIGIVRRSQIIEYCEQFVTKAMDVK
ncbi:CBS domain containing membrane protein [Paenibacillus alvei TS-15]|jgi:CBS domain-containing protein|uniref:CBS domain containing membrane protein n=4 Tax=Paenibacillus TaxID=44249 RepID=S9U1Z5_PAEAL|nr:MULTISPECIES: CBS domain-containing protein [Paenibacillus]EPY08531.1 CBS domain containing membrane protein [Paenibacillus alvei TS-15]EPY09913.1 CBS domain containing membrane protein [Paenibacillus alvei A6-6i-x]MCM3288989.1 CBS domain-containing protein [Paenibacillus sp. MER 180]MCY9529052.1 CBS domain-containing protein [Paenibacillus alvei]MDT8978745.1 CBS domain-containing protein [Paenibacillus sp. chi10]